MNLFHDWLKNELGYSWVNLDGTNRFNAQVNYNFFNAYAGNPMTFGTNNFARSCDVIYHECTYNILYHEYGDYIGWPDSIIEAYAMDEGFADYFACSFTNSSIMGEGCFANPRKYYFSDPHESNLLSALYRAADIDNNLLNGLPYFNDIQQAFHSHDLLQAVLDDEDSFDFSTNTLGNVTGGDLYYYQGKFWANNVNQKGVIDLGNIGNVDLATVNIPISGYTRFGVAAVVDHTYVSIAQEGEIASYIAFRVNALSSDKTNVTIRYLYRFNPDWYVANLNSKEIHMLDCYYVSAFPQMSFDFW